MERSNRVPQPDRTITARRAGTRAAAALAVVLIAAACGAEEAAPAPAAPAPAPAPSPSTPAPAAVPDFLGAMQDAGCARAAVSQAPPYSEILPSGEAGGYLPTLTATVFAGLDVPDLCSELTTFDAMIPGLQAGRFDVLPGGLNVTAERCEVIIYSQPVTLQFEAIAVPTGNPKGLTDFASIAADPTLKLAVFSGSSQEAFALAQGVSASQIVTVPDSQLGVEAVKSGRANAFGAGQFTLELSFAQKGEPIEVIADRSSKPSMIGIGFPKDEVATRDLFDAELERLRASGELGALYASFGFPNPDDLDGLDRQDVAPTCS